LRRERQVMGSARGFLASVLFSLLRNRYALLAEYAGADQGTGDQDGGELLALLPPGHEAVLAVFRWLWLDLGASPDQAKDLACKALDSALEAEKALPGLEAAKRLVDDFASRKTADPHLKECGPLLSQVAECSLSPELLTRWVARFGEPEAMALARAVGQPAPLDIRVNPRFSGRNEALERLHRERIEADATPFAPLGIRLGRKINLRRGDLLAEGSFEVQDEGSQLVCEAVGEGFQGRILDACAGAGGKSLNLSARFGEECEVVACDVDSRRLDRLGKRQRRARAANIQAMTPEEAENHESYDAVLIDAPCLGLGRLRRDPTILWHGGLEERLEEVTRLQRECLEHYALLLRPGGILVYAVCSFEPEETERQIEAFLTDFPEFRRAALPPLFADTRLADSLSADKSTTMLLPHHHGTDGFFIARLERRT